ncbi:hypothetical protein SAMN05216227_103524 [Pseudorhodobacter antarcticus]|uniref:Uncharacterized protein n=1 Tax=Pseudorhodobacter antarcticus TaxID=1077947 RepID=A0A1H8KVC2_9RHOB|nr:hypothetical protein [Pseudorhodobacter antarcticus]SEN96761.1 hypothetical protein SAMN05216227_103524 [Pseudorhodobacter antarcticus]
MAAGTGHTVLVIFDYSDPAVMTGLHDSLSGVAGKVRVGISAYLSEMPEDLALRPQVLDMFDVAGFTTCPIWGTDNHEDAPIDVYEARNATLRGAFDVAKTAALIVDNGPVTTAGQEWGQEYLLPGVGISDDRLFVIQKDTAIEIRDGQSFSAIDLLIDSEVFDISVWDCMKGRP